MQTQSVSNVTFGYSHPLKTLYKKGKIPLKKGFYGGTLTKRNVTIEHLKCVSDGGKTELDNVVLCCKDFNSLRGNRPLSEVINYKAMGEYFEVFKDKTFGCINGNDYIQKCMKTIYSIIK